MSVDFRILNKNFAQLSNVNLSATSEDNEFPAINVREVHRSEVWRSSGYFEITTSNNKIDIREISAGAEINATIPVGNYSKSDLESQIALSLETATTIGADYTVTFGTTTGLWTIATDKAFLELLWSSGTNTATSVGATIGFDVSVDDTAATSYVGSTIALHTTERLIIDLVSTNEPIDSFGLVFQPNDIKFSEQAVLKLLGNPTNSWASPDVSVTLTLDDESNVVTHFFTSDQAKRYWAVEITDPENPNLFVELSKVILSKATNLNRAPSTGFSYSVEDQSRVSSTDFGQEYFDIQPNRANLSWNFSLLTYAQTETLLDIYSVNGTVTPVTVALDTQETLFDKDRFFIYGRFRSSFSPGHRVRDVFDFDLDVEEAF